MNTNSIKQNPFVAALLVMSECSFETWVACINNAKAAMSLEILQRENSEEFYKIHSVALDFLADRLRIGENILEELYMSIFTRLAETLTYDLQKLAELVENYQEVPLHKIGHQQNYRFYEMSVLFLQGELSSANMLCEELLSSTELSSGLRGRFLNAHAVFLAHLGQYEESIRACEQCIEIWAQLEEHVRMGRTLMNLGTMHYELKRYEDAERFLSQALEIAATEKSENDLAGSQNQLAKLYIDMGEWTAAESLLTEAIAYWNSQDNHDIYAAALSNLGRLDLLQGRWTDAKETLRTVLESLTSDLNAIESILDLGLIAQIEGDLTTARQYCQRALDIVDNTDIPRNDIRPRVHYQMAEVLCRMNEDQAALEHYIAAIQNIEQSHRLIRREELKISFLGRWQQIYESLVLHCIRIGEPEQAFKWAERARARTLAEALGSVELPEQAPVELRDVQAALPANTAMLCYFTTGVLEHDIPMLQRLKQEAIFRKDLLTEPETILFIITQDDLQIHFLGDPNNFVFPLKNIEHIMTPPVSQGMYQILLGPVSKRDEYRQVYITPHGPLHHIPFAALLDGAGQPWLREQGPALAYAPSPTLFVQRSLVESEPESIGNAYAMGYNGQNLRYAEAEAQRVAQITSGIAQVGSDLQKEQLQHEMARYRLLHFSCHADFDVQEPMNSFLEIGPDQRLTAAEILREWHLQTDLVTLSACQTGISKVLRSDEPMGLVRALLYAGSRAVLVTLWPVEDLPTLLFMEIFYQRLVENVGLDIASALKVAQIRLRQLTIAKIRLITQTWDHVPEWDKSLDDSLCPFENAKHWAAFALIGS